MTAQRFQARRLKRLRVLALRLDAEYSCLDRVAPRSEAGHLFRVSLAKYHRKLGLTPLGRNQDKSEKSRRTSNSDGSPIARERLLQTLRLVDFPAATRDQLRRTFLRPLSQQVFSRLRLFSFWPNAREQRRAGLWTRRSCLQSRRTMRQLGWGYRPRRYQQT